MRATLVVVLATLLFADAAAARVRILVTPIRDSGAGGDETAKTLTRAVETALAGAVKDVEIVTPAALDTAIEIESARDCVGPKESDDSKVVSSCLSELADAIDVDVIARPSLGRIGSELVLTLTLLDGERAVVVAQGQRRADKDSPEALLDQIPGLAKEVAKDADLVIAGKRKRAVPVGAIVVAGSGAVVAGLGVGALAVRGVYSGDYERGALDRDEARAYEFIDVPFLIGGIGAVVVGGVTALVAGGVAVWSAVSPEE